MKGGNRKEKRFVIMNLQVPLDLLEKVDVIDPGDEDFVREMRKLLNDQTIRKHIGVEKIKPNEKMSVYVHRGDLARGLRNAKLWVRYGTHLTFMAVASDNDEEEYNVTTKFLSWKICEDESMKEINVHWSREKKTFKVPYCKDRSESLEKEFDRDALSYPYYIGLGEVAQYLVELDRNVQNNCIL